MSSVHAAWLTIRFEHKLTGALLIMLAFTVAMALFAYAIARQAHYAVERTRLARDVLDNYRRVESITYELAHVLGRSLLSDVDRKGADTAKISEALLLKELDDTLTATRKSILSEIAFVGNAANENEQEELDRIVAIERLFRVWLGEYQEFDTERDQGQIAQARARLKTMLESPTAVDIRKLVRLGIDDEVDETSKAEKNAHALLNASEAMAIVSIGLAAIFGLLAIFTLVGTVRRPLALLREGATAYTSDDLSYRIPVIGKDEFAELARSFNAMAAERESRRNALLAQQQQLEQAVANRTQELLDANRALELADSSRRRFLADVSHELRTPLTIMRGESDVALRGADKSVEEYKSALRRVQEQATHTAGLVDDLLFLARREAFELRLRQQHLSLADIIRQTSNEFEAMAVEHRVPVGFQNETTDDSMIGDAARLKQLIVICLDNAIRYTLPDGRVTVLLKSSERSLRLEVKDQGIGIAIEDLPHVFTRFYRGAQAQRYYAHGTGLGLPMAKAIAEAHGGTIDIESELDRGTTVIVTLPATTWPKVAS